ncbi:mannose-1-phosphate guanyltransferase [Gammaproteobacteria bacterium 45_16_T64]|nr:mannose-1-phosphate guanyltransferase [Gammaproteobacteria bacterium 45_16_T64]
MKVMILAAGKGTRVWPVTKVTPKPMIPILRKPIMESLIDHFKSYGVKEFVVNTSYMSSSIENYFRDGTTLGVDITYSFEGKIVDNKLESAALGSAGGMKKIQEFSGFFDDTFMVVCGDAWIDLDVKKVCDFHKKKGGVATIVLQDVEPEEVHKYGVVKIGDDGQILQFQEKPDREEAISNSVNTGIYIFEPDIFNYIPKDEEFDIGSQLFPLLVQEDVPFYGISSPFQWVDVGNLTDIWQATRDILTDKITGYPKPGREVRPGVWCGINLDIDFDKVDITGPICIGNGTRIEDGAVIKGPAMIGANCIIEKGAVIEECLIDDYTWVSSVVELSGKVLFGGHCINQSGDYVDMNEWDIGWAINDSRCNIEELQANSQLLEALQSVNVKDSED